MRLVDVDCLQWQSSTSEGGSFSSFGSSRIFVGGEVWQDEGMSEELKVHYGQLLGLDRPWKVSSVDLKMEEKRIENAQTPPAGAAQLVRAPRRQRRERRRQQPDPVDQVSGERILLFRELPDPDPLLLRRPPSLTLQYFPLNSEEHLFIKACCENSLKEEIDEIRFLRKVAPFVSRCCDPAFRFQWE